MMVVARISWEMIGSLGSLTILEFLENLMLIIMPGSKTWMTFFQLLLELQSILFYFQDKNLFDKNKHFKRELRMASMKLLSMPSIAWTYRGDNTSPLPILVRCSAGPVTKRKMNKRKPTQKFINMQTSCIHERHPGKISNSKKWHLELNIFIRKGGGYTPLKGE